MSDLFDFDSPPRATRSLAGKRLNGWQLQKSLQSRDLNDAIVKVPTPVGGGRNPSQKQKSARSETQGKGKNPCGKCGADNDPCRHLKKGSDAGTRPYRGGSYSQLTGVGHLGMEVDHIPPKSVSPLSEATSPALQMKKKDHRRARSTSSSKRAKEWREQQAATAAH